MTHDDPNPLESGYGNDGHSNDGGSVLPAWVFDLKGLTAYVDELTEFASNPVRYVRSKVAVWLVAGIISAIEATTGRIRWFWGIIADAFGSAGDSVDYAFTSAGDIVLDAVAIVPNLIESMATELGPIAGPIVVGVGGALLLWGAWQVLKRSPKAVWTLYQAIPGT